MEMITSDSENQLAECLLEVEREAAAWMGAHINLSPLHEQLLNREGLSKQSLDKVLQLSMQMADRLMQLGLKECEGMLFVFQDSDLLCLFRKKDKLTDAVMNKLQHDFKQNQLLHLLHFYNMEDRLASIIALSTTKQDTADNYRLKHRAIAMAEGLVGWGTPDPEITRLIQKKRQLRNKGCVLIVEDDILTRGLIHTLLKKDYQVVQAKDAREGIMHYIDNAPDVVFLDIHLPGMSGNEVLKRLKTLDPQAYIVMLSGDSVRDNIVAAQKYGAAGFVRKPFSKEKVLDYVRKCPLLEVGPAIRALGWRKQPLPGQAHRRST